MPNIQSPYGFRHVSNLVGQPANFGDASALIAQAYATPIFFGDPVTLLTTGYIRLAVPGDQIHGIFIGYEGLSTSRGYKWRSNWYGGSDLAADATAWVITHPQAVFQIQTGNSAAAAVAATQALVGSNIGFATGAGNTGSGVSGAYADLSTAAVTATLSFRVVGLVKDPPGVNGADVTTPFNDILVAFNNQDYKSLTGI